MLLVRKKDGKRCFCIDYRCLNAVMEQNAYPLPRIDNSLDAPSRSRYFSTLNLGEPWKSAEGEQAAFNTLKEIISIAPILGYLDPRRQYILDTDTSGCGVEAVLSQVQEGWRGPLREGAGKGRGPLAAWVPTSCLDRTPALDRAGSILGNVAYPGGPAGNPHETPAPTVARLNLDAGGSPEGLSALLGVTGPKGKLARTQATGQGPVAIMYRAIATGEEVPAEHLEVGSRELDILHHMRGSLRIQQDGVAGSTRGPAEPRQMVRHLPPEHVSDGLSRVARCARPQSMEGRRQPEKKGGSMQDDSDRRWPWIWWGYFLSHQRKKAGAGSHRPLYPVAGPLALPDATATVVANTLDEWVFCYLGLLEQIHRNQEAQFESQLMAKLCQLWNVGKTHTTPYHPQTNGIGEWNNRGLGNSLRALLLAWGQDEWDLLLPQLMRA
ncbi:uncharacterized protein [Watersipora subatra]|uniref:uncharacterized protein n=1 Tax=Watersipora subatra TaxID=2589382 RepID=UPI00355C6B96